MQAFYTQLFSTTPSAGSYLHGLAKLAQASLSQIAALKSDLAWGDWAE